MEELTTSKRALRFGLYEVDFAAQELRKSGIRIKIQDQPFQILALLLERPGQIVTREEIQKRLWAGDTFVDFDLGLNSAVKKLRQALGDESDNPRFVETLYRRGYRFIAPVATPQNGGVAHGVVQSTPTRGPAEEAVEKDSDERSSGEASATVRRGRGIWLAIALVVLLVAALLYIWLPKQSPRVLGITQITHS